MSDENYGQPQANPNARRGSSREIKQPIQPRHRPPQVDHRQIAQHLLPGLAEELRTSLRDSLTSARAAADTVFNNVFFIDADSGKALTFSQDKGFLSATGPTRHTGLLPQIQMSPGDIIEHPNDPTSVWIVIGRQFRLTNSKINMPITKIYVQFKRVGNEQPVSRSSV